MPWLNDFSLRHVKSKMRGLSMVVANVVLVLPSSLASTPLIPAEHNRMRWRYGLIALPHMMALLALAVLRNQMTSDLVADVY